MELTLVIPLQSLIRGRDTMPMDQPAQATLTARNSDPSRATVAEFERESTNWEERYQHASFQARELAFGKLLNRLTLAGQRWLDAGCGSGRFSRILAERGATVKGVDAAEGMVDAATRITATKTFAASPAPEFQKIETIEALAEPSGDYQGVLCSSVLEYVDQPQRAIAEFARLLSNGGHLLISVPNRGSLVRRTQKILYSVTRMLGLRPRPGYLEFSKHDYSLASFSTLLAEHGFEVVGHETYSATTKINDATLLVVLAQKK
jgi:2-polyprenyl-3-methyl-5-hydroxy-6-metoxy-1,4-benzoquinol methylase